MAKTKIKNPTALNKHSLRIAGHTTSVSLEGIFWEVLKDIAKTRKISLNALAEEIDRERVKQPEPANLSSSLRTYVMAWLQQQ